MSMMFTTVPSSAIPVTGGEAGGTAAASAGAGTTMEPTAAGFDLGVDLARTGVLGPPDLSFLAVARGLKAVEALGLETEATGSSCLLGITGLSCKYRSSQEETVKFLGLSCNGCEIREENVGCGAGIGSEHVSEMFIGKIEEEIIGFSEENLIYGADDDSAALKGVSGYLSVEETGNVSGFRQKNDECRLGFGDRHESEMCVGKIEDEITGVPRENLIFRAVLESKCVFSNDADEDSAVMKGVSGNVSVEETGNVSGLRRENVEFALGFGVEHESEMCVTKTKDEISSIPQEGLIFDGALGSKTCDNGGVKLETPGQIPANSSRMKHICKFCEKGFRSGHALGGHRLHCPPSRRSCITKGGTQSEPVVIQKFGPERVELGVGIGRKSSEAAIEPAESQKSGSESVEFGANRGLKRPRRCLICSKDFSSGQALGGHMRAHFQRNPRSCEKKSDALDHEIPGGSLLPVA